MELRGVEEMSAESARLVRGLKPHPESATVIALSGELGAGKTTLAQGIARALSIDENVTSPTFVIEKIYHLSGQKFERLIHIDAYRLNDAHELEVLGWREIAADPQNIIIVEWPERVAALIPSGALWIALSGSDDARTIVYG